MAQIEKIKTFLAAANNEVEEAERKDRKGGEDGLYWADVVLVDQNENEERLHLQSSQTQASSRAEQRKRRKSWLEENIHFVQFNHGESQV